MSPEPPTSPPGSLALKHIAFSNPSGYSVILSAELKESGIATPNNAPLCLHVFLHADARNSLIGNYEKHWPPKAFYGACTG